MKGDLKHWLLLIASLIAIVVNSQSDGIVVPRLVDDSRYTRAYYSQFDAIVLTDSEFHIIGRGPVHLKRIITSDFGCDDCIPIYGRFRSKNILDLNWLDVGGDSLRLWSTTYNLDDSIFSKSTILTLDVKKGYCTFSKAKPYRESHYLCITCDSISTNSNMFALIRFENNGQVELAGIKKNSGFGVPSGIFELGYVKDIEIVGDDRILISGLYSHSLFLGSFNFDEIFIDQVEYFDPTINELVWSWDPFLSKKSNQEIIGSCSYPYRGSRVFQEHYLRIKINVDSFHVDTLIIVPDLQGAGKFDSNGTYLGENIVMTYSNEDLFLTSDKSNTPCNFYVSMIRDDSIIWHKEFGGDLYYRVKDIEKVDSCMTLIVGSVYNYYGDNLLNGFYAFVDCTGDLITADSYLKRENPKLFPNPTSDVFSIELGRAQEVHVEIYSISGKLVFADAINGKSINVSSLPIGYYIVNLKIDNLESIGQILIQR